MEIPVYLFTGFLESGKTTFIQDALEGDDFNAGERTLFLLCEEGEEEYHPSRFFGTNVFFETIDSPEEMTQFKLKDLQLKHKVERVIIEYNGMWELDDLYRAYPEDWLTYQEVMFCDATMFKMQNDNMRQLVYDKLKSAELVVFNRCDHDKFTEDIKLEYHKIVRAANRRAQIIYEYGRDDVEMDNIPDPLPFDINQSVIKIKDEDYAEWYRDMNEEGEMAKYDGKTLKVKGRAVTGGDIPEGKFVFGRHVMTCCVEDIQFAGLVCRWNKPIDFDNGDWISISAKVKIEEDPIYGPTGPGPVLYCTSVKPAQPASPEVATFF